MILIKKIVDGKEIFESISKEDAMKLEDKKDLLYPFVEKFIEKVDVENKKIYLSPIKGMID